MCMSLGAHTGFGSNGTGRAGGEWLSTEILDTVPAAACLGCMQRHDSPSRTRLSLSC